MKKVILVFTGFLFSVGSFAQADSITNRMNQENYQNKADKQRFDRTMDKSNPEVVMMQNGKMMKVKDGVISKLDSDIIMSNGTKVMIDGTYTNNEGASMIMKDGQAMDMGGNIVTLKNPETIPKKRSENKVNDNINSVPDSVIKNNNNQK